MDKWEQYQAAYQKADQKTKDLIHSSLIPECVQKVIELKQLEASQKKLLVKITSDHILELLSNDEMVAEIRNIGVPDAESVSAEIMSCTTTMKPTVLDTSLIIDESTNTIQVNTNIKAEHQLASEIAEAEATMQTIQPIRTMSHDMETMRSVMNDEQVHTAASQADILDRTTTDKATDDRWNTAQT